jgi:hypothetical protein
MASVTLDLDRLREKDLPDCCMCCGAPATRYKKRTFQWYPPWVWAIIIVALLPGAIVASLLTKRVRMPVPLCENHTNYWVWRNLVIWGSFLALVLLFAVGMVVSIQLEGNRPAGAPARPLGGYVCMGTFILGVIWVIIALVIQGTAIRPTLIDDYEIRLTNVSPEFEDALDEHRRELKRKRMARMSAGGAAVPADTMACPYCGEQIKKQARRCKYCKEDLVEDDDEYD